MKLKWLFVLTPEKISQGRGCVWYVGCGWVRGRYVLLVSIIISEAEILTGSDFTTYYVSSHYFLTLISFVLSMMIVK